MRRTRSGCCALAVSGHVAAPPSSVMNSRRLMWDMGFPSRLGVPRTRAVSLPHLRVPPKPPAGPWACAVTPYLKAPASLGPGNSWLVFEKELDDALDVSAKASDEVRARLDENRIRIFRR